ncbi:ppp1r13b protein [Stylonychia lemnae]|uniref:Ppp1r13b protein n=1 Tax=Stylonychia lemnae TaxID=5949 RepID=A0A078AAP7_STYLE|nr:ppp1r13b protein [Stylonychia lemnae]|eukprot:CDW79355.1 ppp1r13b protein [Stylonychia lemnae]
MNKYNQETIQDPQTLMTDFDLAPLSQDYFNSNDRYLDIDIGVFDYAFKCIQGPYAGKFFYINSSPHGEIIGGIADYDIKRNPAKLTMYVENNQLAERHALIQLNSHCQYLIQDVSPIDSTGIWIKVPTTGEGMDLYRNNNFRRKFMINNFSYVFEFKETDQILLDLYHWLRINQLDHGYQLMLQEGIVNFGTYFQKLKDFIDRNQLNQEYLQNLILQTKDLKNSLNYLSANGQIKNQDFYQEKKQLVCQFKSGPQIQFGLDGYQGYLVSGPKTQNANIIIEDDNLNDMNLYIIFKLGSYYIVGDHSESNIEESHRSTNPYFKLFKDEKYHLQPGQIVNLGLSSYIVERFNTGVIADVGTRGSMEDTYIISQDIGIDDYLKVSLFAVIDGHGGENCAIFLRQRIEQEIRKELTDPDLGLKSKGKEGANECITNALRRAFLTLDEQFYQEFPKYAIKCGAAVVCVLIVGNRVFCANNRKDEADRVKNNGGTIACERVQNKLAITRAFGDFEFKLKHFEDKIERTHYLIAEPEIRLMDIDPFIDDFIVIGSDGLYDKFSSQEVVNFIRAKLGAMPLMDQDVSRVAREITSECILAQHVKDNVTTIIVALNRGIKLN